MMKRTFIAVKVDAGEKTRDLLLSVREELRGESIKWVDIDNMHITIAFLGDTSDDAVTRVSSMLMMKITGEGSFTFSLKGLGVFRNIKNPRVIWAGTEDIKRLNDIYTKITEGLNELRIETDKKQFNPHLTLGRIRNLNNKKILADLVDKYKQDHFQDVQVSEIIYYQSILSESGPRYIPIINVKLQKK